MNKVVGYSVSIIGLVVMALGFGMVPFKIALLDGIAGNLIAGAGVVLIIVGVVLSLISRGKKQVKEEVPIYEGDTIVGYRRA